MSVDIDWTLLSGPTSGLADGLVSVLNEQLNTAARPSFLGPVTVTTFDFGTAGPSVEIKDVRDVWRAFDEGDDEGDADAAAAAVTESRYDDYSDLYEYEYEPLRRYTSPHSYLPHNGARTTGTTTPARPYGIRHASSPHIRSIPTFGMSYDDDNESTYSLGSRSIASVGIGMGVGLGVRRFASPMRRSRAHSHQTPTPSAPQSVEPGSPPARPAEDNSKQSNIPAVQMHLRVEHTADMSLTLNTSLQVNYPSALFMSLPLKLVITGLAIAADVVVAYSSRKHRVHITIVDEEGGGQGVGQRILPHLHIESEIGHADAHVLRNVGKVERFIVDVLRKTLVEELVFPNFHTIAL